MSTYAATIERDGFAIVPAIIDPKMILRLKQELECVGLSRAVSQRSETAFAIRNLLNEVPATRVVAADRAVSELIKPIVGTTARVVRGIFFDKTPEANWKVAWHQDVTIAVERRIDVEGFSAWTLKAGIVHVQPPISVLQDILTLRIHLDDTDESNGALKVLPGSHLIGRLTQQDIEVWKRKTATVTCCVPTGGALLMRPLLIHSSSVSPRPTHRRVLHLDFSARQLPGGLRWYGS